MKARKLFTIYLDCVEEEMCKGNGKGSPSGGCHCDNGWDGDDCSVRLFPPSSCNIYASLVARLGGNSTIADSSYQLYGIIFLFLLFAVLSKLCLFFMTNLRYHCDKSWKRVCVINLFILGKFKFF